MPIARGIDGVGISYQVRGSGSPVLVFMHGWSGSGEYFADTIDALDLSRVRTVTVDLRGHGGSDHAAGFGFDDIAADVLTVADAVGAETFVVFGFSMSAKFAQYVAVKAPHRVSGLILVAGCPVSEIPFPPELRADWLARVGDGEALAALTQQYASRPLPAKVMERIAAAAARVPLAALTGTFESTLDRSFAERVDVVRSPTVVVGGTQDAIFTPDVLRAGVLAPLPQARLALLECGHEIPVELPQQLAAVTEGFLAGLTHRD
jgi:pimeloyl-ACP methyl ester carboxylesterase